MKGAAGMNASRTSALIVLTIVLASCGFVEKPRKAAARVLASRLFSPISEVPSHVALTQGSYRDDGPVASRPQMVGTQASGGPAPETVPAFPAGEMLPVSRPIIASLAPAPVPRQQRIELRARDLRIARRPATRTLCPQATPASPAAPPPLEATEMPIAVEIVIGS
jgi:hypothetical protein